MKKRIISFVLSLVMVLSMIPAVSFVVGAANIIDYLGDKVNYVDGKYVLTDNVTISEGVEVPSGIIVNTGENIIELAGDNVTVSGGGKITSSSNDVSPVTVSSSGNVSLNGVTIESTGSAPAVSIMGNAQIESGTVNGGIAMLYGSLTINGGTVNGEITRVYDTGTITVNGGVFSDALPIYATIGSGKEIVKRCIDGSNTVYECVSSLAERPNSEIKFISGTGKYVSADGGVALSDLVINSYEITTSEGSVADFTGLSEKVARKFNGVQPVKVVNADLSAVVSNGSDNYYFGEIVGAKLNDNIAFTVSGLNANTRYYVYHVNVSADNAISYVGPISTDGSGNLTISYNEYSPFLIMDGVNTYRVEYDGNGASSNIPNDSIVTEGLSYLISNKKPIREDFIFGGWKVMNEENKFLKADGSWSTVAAEAKVFNAGDVINTVSNHLTLIAQWTPVVPVYYKVSWNVNDDTYTVSAFSNPLKVLENDEYTFTVAPASGYTIEKVEYTIGSVTAELTGTSGFYNIPAVTGDATITVTTKAKEYTVSYNVNGADVGTDFTDTKVHNVPLTVNDGTGLSKTGYTFQGWALTSNGSVSYPAGASISDNKEITLYAVWAANTYNVTLDADGGVIGYGDVKSYVYGVGATLPNGSAVTKEGYTFEGWYEGSTLVTEIPADATGDKVYTAKWTIKTFKVFLPTTLVGCTASWTTPPYEVTVNYGEEYAFDITVNDGYDSSALEVTANNAPLYPISTVGSTFSYKISNIKGDQLIAVNGLTLKTYSVRFDGNGGSGEPDGMTVKHNSDITIPGTVPTRENYEFLGWDTDKTATTASVAADDEITSVTADTTYYAIWSAKTYTIRMDKGEGFTCSADINYTVEAPADKTFTVTIATGYDGTNAIVRANGVALTTTDTDSPYTYTVPAAMLTGGDIIISVDGVVPATYTITYNTNGGTINEAYKDTYTYGEGAMLPIDVVKEGYTFSGWTVADEPVSASNPAVQSIGKTETGNKTFYAQWAKKTYTVTIGTISPSDKLTCDKSGITNVDYDGDFTFTVTFDKTVIDASKLDVAVNGEPAVRVDSSSSGNVITNTYKISHIKENKVITVIAEELATYTITYDANNGTGAPASQTKTYGIDLALSDTIPTRTGYNFLGWSTSGEDDATVMYAPGEIYMGNASLALYAVWEIKTYNVVLVEGEGYTIGAFGGYATPVNHGDDFKFVVFANAGWTVDDVKVNDVSIGVDANDLYTISGITENKTVTVTVSRTTKTVTYYGNRPSTANSDPTGVPATQSKEYGINLTLSSGQPTLTGHTFLGWATSESGPVAYNPGQVYAIDEALDLYAVWSENVYPVTLVTNGGNIAEGYEVTEYRYSEGTTLPTMISKIGYAFAGWNDAEDLEGNIVTAIPQYSTGAKTYYAMWSKDLTVTLDLTNATNTASNVVFTSGVSEKLAGGDPVSITFTAASGKTLDRDSVKVYTDVANKVELTDYIVTVNADGTVTVAFAMPDTAVVVVVKDVQRYGMTLTVEDNNGIKTLDSGAMKFTYNGVTETPAFDDVNFTVTVTGQKSSYTTEEPAKIPAGASVSLSYELNDGYHTVSQTVQYTDENGGKQDVQNLTVNNDGAKYTITFTMPAGDITVDLKVAKDYSLKYVIDDADATKADSTDVYKVSGTTYGASVNDVTNDGADYTIYYDADGAATIKEGAKVQFRVEANVDAINGVYNRVRDVYVTYSVNGVDKEVVLSENADGTYSFNMPAADAVIHVDLKDHTTVSVTAPAAGTEVFEGTRINLTATVEKTETFAKNLTSEERGTVYFYWASEGDLDSVDDIRDTNEIGSADVTNNGTATIENFTVPSYDAVTDGNCYIYVIYNETPYFLGSMSEALGLKVRSTAITWKLNGNAIDTDANVLTVSDSLVATDKTTLTIPSVYAFDDMDTPLTVGKDYQVTWEYMNADGSWTEYDSDHNTNSVDLTPEYKTYQFRALITPIPGDATPYTKTVKYTDDGTVAADTLKTESGKQVYTNAFYSIATVEVVLKPTSTTLAITGAETEADDVVINNSNTEFAVIGDHNAQFEAEKVTLVATVVDSDDNTVNTGYVNFYRVGETTPLNRQPVAVESNGTAEFKVVISAYDTTKSASENYDNFYAEYIENDTYDDSKSDDTAAIGMTKTVFIKSTSIKTPIITSALEGKVGSAVASATTYDDNLTDLLAGVEHSFTLKTSGANTTDTADWSVVALDGRTVDADNYEVQWNVKTGANTETSDTVGTTFVLRENKIGDEIYVTLIPVNHMKVGADSKKAIIGTKQDVTITVTTSDEIPSTPAKDAYQLDEVTLTATVAAKESDATMDPSGTVEFFYKAEGGDWTKIGETTDLEPVAGVITASIVTTDLPVKDVTNTKQDLVISATYSGDNTFNGLEKDATADVTTADITIYSSVVYVDENENTTNIPGEHGITISVIDGLLNANETEVTLGLSDVYTLDHGDVLSKLKFGTDYKVQWQVLRNAAAYTDKTTAAWEDIPDGNNVQCPIVVEQGAAYRAEITVDPETDINRGSYTMVDQEVKGRQVYYSNILIAANGMATVSVNVNTSNTSDGFEGIVQNETVTIGTFVSGATNTTPISKMTITINNGTEDVYTAEKTDVNGYMSFDWTPTTPGYYTLTIKSESSNGYDPRIITRELIVRDAEYSFTATNTDPVYNGKAQGMKVEVNGMDIEDELAQKSVVVYYYSDADRTNMVEPKDAGTYYATIRLQESAYWTEMTEDIEFTIEKRGVSIVDLVAQAKVYDGIKNANIQEIVLEDAAVDANGTAAGVTGVLNGESIYAVGNGVTSSADAGTVTLNVANVVLKGDDAGNYEIIGTYAGEDFVIMRNQLKGDIADATYKYTGSAITIPADDIAIIDQQGNEFLAYEVTYYYHNGDGVEKVDAMKYLGMYTIVVTAEDFDNYKGGAVQKVYVGASADDAAPTAPISSTIDLKDTVVLYDGTEKSITATSSQGNPVTVTYSGADSVTEAGRYLVVAEDSVTHDKAYGIFTIVKADQPATLTAENVTYNSAQQDGNKTIEDVKESAETYYTFTGGTIQGVSYTAPTEAGTYVVTAHMNETANYAASEVSAVFTIEPKPLTITADSWQRHQYGAYPAMTATFSGLADGGVAPDTSMRDVQIQPELILKDFSNSGLDQVGRYPIIPVAALARNYEITYVNGQFNATEVDAKPELAIHGMISNGDGAKNIAYYGDEIQLYPYGTQKDGVVNNSSYIKWDVTGPATITQDGVLTITGVGDITVKLTRGAGIQSISTEIQIKALKQELSVNVPNVEKLFSNVEQDYDGTVTALNAKLETLGGVAPIAVAGTSRTYIGSQITTYVVKENEEFYQSEVYGGLFTINDKDVTVTPNAQTVVYGDDLTIADEKAQCTVEGEVGGLEALENYKVASIRELYNNLDTANEYEIIVTGTENINYNVHYAINPANKVTVTERPLTITTGVYKGMVGQTSGSLNPEGEYPVDGALFSAADLAKFTKDTFRMYGEPNQVMGYVIETLIDGDSEADLAVLLDWLVEYDFNIAGNASITYGEYVAIDPADYPGYAIPGTYTQVINTSMNLVNYSETIVKGTQLIYQRPVTLSLTTGTDSIDIYYEAIMTSVNRPETIDEAKLLAILKTNLEVGKYNGKGGLAELLNHTIDNLDLKLNVITIGYNASSEVPKFKVEITVGNPNYWSETYTVTVNITKAKLVPTYHTLYKTYSTVSFNYVDDQGNQTPAKDLENITYLIYRRVPGKNTYSAYKDSEKPVRKVTMTHLNGNTYKATFSTLPMGDYVMFAVVSGYTIVDR